MSLIRNPNIYYGMGRRRRRRPRRGGSFFSAIGDTIGKVGHFLKENHALSRAVGLIPHPLGLAGSLGLRAIGLGRRRRRVGRPRRRGGLALTGLTKNAIISKAVGLIPRPLRTSLGLGRRRRVRRQGGSIVSSLLLKALKLVPRSLLLMGRQALGLGRRRIGRPRVRRVGRPRVRRVLGIRRRRYVRRGRGGEVSGATLNKYIKDKRILSDALNHFAPGSNLSGAASALGYGRRRPRRRMMNRRRGGAYVLSTEQIAVPRF